MVATLQPVERVAGTNVMHLAIGLPLRDREGLTNLLRQLYDPASPQYRKYLTPEQFSERHGPSREDYEAVVNFARSNGLEVAHFHPNRLLLDVIGSVAQVEQTFRLRLNAYQHPHEARRFFAPDAEPSVDSQLPILDIGGLDNYALPHRVGGKPRPLGGSGGATPLGGTGPLGTYMAQDIRNAYIPGVTLTDAGQSVAIVSFDGYYKNDILIYERTNNLPNVPLTNVLVDWSAGKITDFIPGGVSRSRWILKWPLPWHRGYPKSSCMRHLGPACTQVALGRISLPMTF